MSRSDWRGSLEGKDCFPLCAKPYRLLQHATVRQVHASFQNFPEPHFQPRHVEQRKPSRTVEIAHQIDVRLGRGLPARDRAE